MAKDLTDVNPLDCIANGWGVTNFGKRIILETLFIVIAIVICLKKNSLTDSGCYTSAFCTS